MSRPPITTFSMPSFAMSDDHLSSSRSIKREYDESNKTLLEQITFNLNKNGQIWIPLSKVVLRDQTHVLPKLGSKQTIDYTVKKTSNKRPKPGDQVKLCRSKSYKEISTQIHEQKIGKKLNVIRRRSCQGQSFGENSQKMKSIDLSFPKFHTQQLLKKQLMTNNQVELKRAALNKMQSTILLRTQQILKRTRQRRTLSEQFSHSFLAIEPKHHSETLGEGGSNQSFDFNFSRQALIKLSKLKTNHKMSPRKKEKHITVKQCRNSVTLKNDMIQMLRISNDFLSQGVQLLNYGENNQQEKHVRDKRKKHFTNKPIIRQKQAKSKPNIESKQIQQNLSKRVIYDLMEPKHSCVQDYVKENSKHINYNSQNSSSIYSTSIHMVSLPIVQPQQLFPKILEKKTIINAYKSRQSTLENQRRKISYPTITKENSLLQNNHYYYSQWQPQPQHKHTLSLLGIHHHLNKAKIQQLPLL